MTYHFKDQPTADARSALLVGIDRFSVNAASTEAAGGIRLSDSLSELRELARTVGLAVVGETSQRLREINPSTLIGSGKIEEIRSLARETGAGIILFDDELTPGQQKNLEKAFGEEMQVVDRTALILDIFAMHAHTNEGKLQVELAQYAYRLPRLTRLWTHLARQAGGRRGGVGLRGPGETQLEIDRRAIRRKIAFLEKEIETVRQRRKRLRARRRGEGFFTAALAGYTNAGKSTLLNALCGSTLYTEDKLFSTLDPTTRRAKLPGGLHVLFTDTVGFISKLPHHLVAAFRSTFEEITEADLVLHLIDASHPQVHLHRRVVECELERTVGANIPVITVYNKIDLLPVSHRLFTGGADGVIGVSALTGEGLPALREEIERRLAGLLIPVVVRIPYADARQAALIRACGLNLVERHDDDGTLMRALVPHDVREKVKRYLVSPDSDPHGD